MDPDSKRLHVSVTDGRGRPVGDGGLARWLEAAAPSGARGEVAVALVSDAHIRTLNRRYRRTNRPTDVLAFPAEPAVPRSSRPRGGPADNSRSSVPAAGPRAKRALFSGGAWLGDIVIAAGVARRQAREAGHPYATELRVLALHGLLHLLGYDHHHPRDRGRMARAEVRLRRKGGLPTGLLERSRAGDSRTPDA